MKVTFIVLLNLLVFNLNLKAQIGIDSTEISDVTSPVDSLTYEKDIVDIIHQLTSKKIHPHAKSIEKREFTHLAFIPAVGYSLQTGAAAVVAANLVFYNGNANAKESSVLASVAYTQLNQIIIPLAANVWSKGNRYNFVSDVRYMNYPSPTFGLGVRSKTANEYFVDYNYLKIHQTVLKSITPDFYLGVGYYYDYFWKIRELNPPENTTTSFQRYGLTPTESASGFALQALFDNRENTVNPKQGIYASLRYRTSYKDFGGDNNWQQMVLEVKKYFHFPRYSKNVLALWNYNWFTTSGKPAYLLLPSTGWDDFFNTGRGYIQGRYRDYDMSYLEAEYRFNVSKNGLIGGVVFANVQTFARRISSEYRTLIPGYGLGLRIKMNKHSSTNLCVDYGFGLDGSGGIAINLGEVF